MKLFVGPILATLLVSCGPHVEGDVPAPVIRDIHAALVADEKSSVTLVDVMLVDATRPKPLICGIYSTPQTRKEGLVKEFAWAGRLLPGTFHDTYYQCAIFREKLYGHGKPKG